MRAALGWALLGALFIALTIISVRMIGAKGTLAVYAFTAAVVVVTGAAVYLITGSLS